MTKREATRIFKEDYLPEIPGKDGPMIRECWNDFTDALRKDGEITQKQYDTWLCPVKTKG